MRPDVPLCKRCLFCLPLRRSLITWGYISLIMYLVQLCVRIMSMNKRLQENKIKAVFENHDIVLSLLKLVLTIIFLIGAHKKNVKLLKIYYMNNLALWILDILESFGLVIFCLYWIYYCYQHSIGEFYPSSLTWRFVSIIVGLIADILLNAYVLLLVRSEIKKLRSNYQFRFTNNAAEAECTMNCEEEVDEETGTADVSDKEICVSKDSNEFRETRDE